MIWSVNLRYNCLIASFRPSSGSPTMEATSSSVIPPPSEWAIHSAKVMGSSTMTSTRFNSRGRVEPGGMNSLAPMIVMGTIGTRGNLAARRATPVLPYCRKGGSDLLDLVPSGKIPRQPPESSTSTARARASLAPVSLKAFPLVQRFEKSHPGMAVSTPPWWWLGDSCFIVYQQMASSEMPS